MPAFESRKDLYQRAVYWPKIGDTVEGQPLLDVPQEIFVRWVDEQREALDPQGATISISSTIVLNFKPPDQSLFWLGALSDWLANNTAAGNVNNTGYEGAGVMQLINLRTTPDIKNRNTRWSGDLMRYRDVLPSATP